MQGSAQLLVDFFTGDYSTMGTIALLICAVDAAPFTRVASRGEHRANRMLAERT
jgi:hypothetical protein